MSGKSGNWFVRHKIMTGILALVAVIAVASAVGSGSGDEEPTAAQAPSSSSSATTETPAAEEEEQAETGDGGPSKEFPMQDGDWRLDSLTVEDNGLGDFGGRARITYTGDDENGGGNIFTVTVFKGEQDIAVLTGSASDVMPGRTVTVQFISSDKYQSGATGYTFQNDL